MNRRMAQGALAVGSIGVLIGFVDVIMVGRPEPYQALPAVIALEAGAELLRGRRPRAARALHVTGSVLLVVAGSVAGFAAWAALLADGTYDWLNLVLGVVMVAYLVLSAGRLRARLRGGRPTAPRTASESPAPRRC